MNIDKKKKLKKINTQKKQKKKKIAKIIIALQNEFAQNWQSFFLSHLSLFSINRYADCFP